MIQKAVVVTLVKALDRSQRQTGWLSGWLASRLAGGWTDVTGKGRFWHLREVGWNLDMI